MNILITEHAKKRLKEMRQEKITTDDIYNAAVSIPGFIPQATRFRGFISNRGRMFDIVAKDIEKGRLIITIIGQ